MKQTVAWTWLWTSEKGYNARVRSAAHAQHGCYALREGSTVLYVGESHTGRLWKTLLRHFQGLASGKFAARAEWTWQDREGVEVALWVTKTAQQAVDLETELI